MLLKYPDYPGLNVKGQRNKILFAGYDACVPFILRSVKFYNATCEHNILITRPKFKNGGLDPTCTVP